MTADSVRGAQHEDMWELIPWLVNGRLSGEAAAPLSAHLEHCEECAREYAEQLRIFSAMQADDSIAFASEAVLSEARDAARRRAGSGAHKPLVAQLGRGLRSCRSGIGGMGHVDRAARTHERECPVPHSDLAGASRRRGRAAARRVRA